MAVVVLQRSDVNIDTAPTTFTYTLLSGGGAIGDAISFSLNDFINDTQQVTVSLYPNSVSSILASTQEFYLKGLSINSAFQIVAVLPTVRTINPSTAYIPLFLILFNWQGEAFAGIGNYADNAKGRQWNTSASITEPYTGNAAISTWQHFNIVTNDVTTWDGQTGIRVRSESYKDATSSMTIIGDILDVSSYAASLAGIAGYNGLYIAGQLSTGVGNDFGGSVDVDQMQVTNAAAFPYQHIGETGSFTFNFDVSDWEDIVSYQFVKDGTDTIQNPITIGSQPNANTGTTNAARVDTSVLNSPAVFRFPQIIIRDRTDVKDHRSTYWIYPESNGDADIRFRFNFGNNGQGREITHEVRIQDDGSGFINYAFVWDPTVGIPYSTSSVSLGIGAWNAFRVTLTRVGQSVPLYTLEHSLDGSTWTSIASAVPLYNKYYPSSIAGNDATLSGANRSGDFLTEAGTPVSYTVEFYDGSDTLLGSSTIASVTSDSALDTATISFNSTIPAGTNYFTVPSYDALTNPIFHSIYVGFGSIFPNVVWVGDMMWEEF